MFMVRCVAFDEKCGQGRAASKMMRNEATGVYQIKRTPRRVELKCR